MSNPDSRPNQPHKVDAVAVEEAQAALKEIEEEARSIYALREVLSKREEALAQRADKLNRKIRLLVWGHDPGPIERYR